MKQPETGTRNDWEIEEPVMARYLWTNYGEVTLFGANGLPVAPFRTHVF